MSNYCTIIIYTKFSQFVTEKNTANEQFNDRPVSYIFDTKAKEVSFNQVERYLIIILYVHIHPATPQELWLVNH